MVQKEFGLWSALLAQANVFVERRHKVNTTNMVACLRRERGNRWDFSDKCKYLITRM